MAMRRRRSFRRRRRMNVYWDRIAAAQSVLPNVLLNNATSLSGAMTSLRRYADSADVVIHRWLWNHLVRIQLSTTGDFASVDANTAIEICVGLTILDSMQDVDGQANNVGLASGTGPLTDADNSRWAIRCCVAIPMGSWVQSTAGGSLAFPVRTNDSHGGAVVFRPISATAMEIDWYCHVDSKVKRKLQGLETEWLTVAMEGTVIGAGLPAGVSVSALMNAQELRNVLVLKR